MSPRSAFLDHLLKSTLLLTAWTLFALLGMLGYEYFGGTTPAWPASGIGIALLVLWGPRYWPAIALGSIFISVSSRVTPIVYVPLAFTNAFEAAGAAWVLRRLNFDPSLARPREVVRLAIVSVLFCLVSALVGIALLGNIGTIHANERLLKGTTWVFGNFLGVLLVAPPLLVWSVPGVQRLSARRIVEIALAAAALAAVGALVFFRDASSAAMPLAFLTVSVVVAAGMRFGVRGGTLATLLVCGIAIVSTALGHGVFATGDRHTATATLMLFEGMLVLTTLFVGATTSDQRRHTDELRRHETMFQGLAEANQLLLASTTWTEAVPPVLATLGRALHLDRAALYQNVNLGGDRAVALNLHRWDAAGLPPTGKPLPRELGYDLPGTRQWSEEFRAGRTVVALADDAPTAGAALLARFGIRSVIVAPIMIDGRCWGFLGLSDCRTPRPWTAEERAIAQTVATNLGIAVRRDELRRELADSVTRYRALQSALPDAYILHDQNGTILDFHTNDRVYAASAPEKAPPLPLEHAFPAEIAARIRDGFKQVAATGEAVVVDYTLTAPTGAPRHYERRIVQAEGGKFLCIVRDVTEHRQSAAHRARMEEKLRETQRLESLGVLAGGIAHDFNNLLTAILGNVSLVRLMLPTGNEVDPMLRQVESASLRAADLCRQMLAYAGRGPLVIERADLSQLVRDTAALLQLSLSQRARLDLDLTDQPLPALVDATQIRQVLMNLIINAAEAMGPHGGQVTLGTGLMRADAAYLAACRSAGDVAPGEFCYIEVADTGAGMSPETLARIFDPFFTTKFTGRGLGLAAVLGIVQGHRGALHVTTQLGAGSVFRVLLPLAPSSPSAAPMPAPSAPAAPIRRTGLVLIVDDEAQVRDTATIMLERLGYRTVTVDSGEKAVEKFRARPGEFKFVLLDLTMPGLDGREVLVALRGLRADLPVIVMSGYDEQESAHRLQGGQAQGFLPKPFTYESLQERLDRAGV
ncbi:MAG: MASE1 domain-containing protein [Opitutae bacterium]|nr:MASE1 domain-containing protein [Opitutae bacterium]